MLCTSLFFLNISTISRGSDLSTGSTEITQSSQILGNALSASTKQADKTVTLDSAKIGHALPATANQAEDLANETKGNGTITQGTYNGEAGYELKNNTFTVTVGKYGEINGLYLNNDAYNTNYVMNAKDNPKMNVTGHEWVGELMLQTKNGDDSSSKWQQENTTYSSDASRSIQITNNKIVVSYKPGTQENGIKSMNVTETYSIDNDNHLKWDITLKNVSGHTLTVGDLGLPLPFREYWQYGTGNKQQKAQTSYEGSVLYHSFVGQNSSYIYVNRPSGIGNFLVMTPDNDTNAGFEYDDHWNNDGTHPSTLSSWCSSDGNNGLNVFYIHSAAIQSTNKGYLPNTALTLANNQSQTYSFNFTASDLKNGTVSNSVSDTSNDSDKPTSETVSSSNDVAGDMSDLKYDQQLKSILYKENIMDAVAVPSMVIPRNTSGKAEGEFYLHTPVDPSSISFQSTNMYNDYVSQRNNANNITNYGDGSSSNSANISYLKEVTKDNEKYQLYKVDFSQLGRNNVIVNYKVNGISKQTTLQFYVIDNPEKALEAHADFMPKTQLSASGQIYDKVFDDWMMDTESTRNKFNGASPLSDMGWGDDWGLSKGTFLGGININTPNKEQVQSLDDFMNTAIWGKMVDHSTFKLNNWLSSNRDNWNWRGFAYPHIYNTYFELYQLEKTYPKLIDYKLSSDEYLVRTYNILKALYLSGNRYNYDTALMGESTTPAIITALKENGHADLAKNIEAIMQTKYQNFAKDKYPYTSEYAYDNTAEEGVYTLAKMNNNANVMHMIDMKTRADRGVQPVWYLYADPVTVNGENYWQFQYTASLADIAMDDWLRNGSNGFNADQLGIAERQNYAAKLANLTEINSGQIDSSSANYGATSWYYQAELGNTTDAIHAGAGKLHNGWMQMSGESELSLWGALQVLSADVAQDPIFGLTGYGASVSESGNKYDITPEDGLRQRLNLINQRLSYEFGAGGKYTKAEVAKDGSTATFNFENTPKTDRNESLSITDPNNVMSGEYRVLFNGKQVSTFKAEGQKKYELDIPVSGSTGTITVTNKVDTDTNTGGSTSSESNSSSTGASSTPSVSSSVSSSSNSESNSSITSSSSTTKPSTSVNVPKSAVKIGSTVYATKKIGMYKAANFKKSQRIAVYAKRARLNRPVFVVSGYARSTNGLLRYQVKDVNRGSKTFGKKGYVTASLKYVQPVYYVSMPKSKVITVISKKGVNSYKKVNQKGKVRHYKIGTNLRVKKIVKYRLTTRYVLANGHYVTGNKKIVIQKSF